MFDTTTAAAFDAVMRARRSVRGFLPAPLPRALIEEVFALAAQAPSNCNVQPWEVHVLSGARLRALGAEMMERASNGPPAQPDEPMVGGYTGIWRERQVGSAVALFNAIGVARDDRPARATAFLRNFDAFGAPHAAFVFLPHPFGLREASDLGGYLQSLMLAMASRGIGSCAQGALSLYPDLVRAHLGRDPAGRLLMGLAFGIEDPDHPANAARTDRAALSDHVFFHE
jgi:nitroreductase